MTHRSTPDFDRMANAAREARERQEAERQAALTAELELVAGEAYNEFHVLFESIDLDHETKMARFRAATAVMRGETSVVVAPPAVSESIDPQLKREHERSQQRSAETEVTEGDEPVSTPAIRAAKAPKTETPAKKVPEVEPETEVTTPAAQPEKLSLLERGKRAWKNG